ncbi:hypothetical protein KLEP7_gp160 [Pseudaeromonas phage vB_PpeM_ KLEP7]|nr:hypothetical protein KLEP7_gp160 [Pseudaeromonas phage vB_PpeM_ KLEP7]
MADKSTFGTTFEAEIATLEDGAEVELSFHPADETTSGWFLDMDSVAEKGWSYLSKKDLEIILDKINELEAQENK